MFTIMMVGFAIMLGAAAIDGSKIDEEERRQINIDRYGEFHDY